jgi:hypothetical protein
MRRQEPPFCRGEFNVETSESPPLSATFAIWHKHCNTPNRPTLNAVEWAAPSVNDDRSVGNIGESGIDVWLNTAKEQAKTPGTERFQAFFFAF